MCPKLEMSWSHKSAVILYALMILNTYTHTLEHIEIKQVCSIYIDVHLYGESN